MFVVAAARGARAQLLASGRAIALMGETFDLGDWLGEDVEGAEPLTDNLKAAFESALSNGILDENWITSLDDSLDVDQLRKTTRLLTAVYADACKEDEELHANEDALCIRVN